MQLTRNVIEGHRAIDAHAQQLAEMAKKFRTWYYDALISKRHYRSPSMVQRHHTHLRHVRQTDIAGVLFKRFVLPEKRTRHCGRHH